MEKKLRIAEDERDKVFEELQTAEEKLLTAEEVATKVFIVPSLHLITSFLSFLLSVCLSVPALLTPCALLAAIHHCHKKNA